MATPPGRGGRPALKKAISLSRCGQRAGGPRTWPRAGCELPEAPAQAQSQALPLPRSTAFMEAAQGPDDSRAGS